MLVTGSDGNVGRAWRATATSLGPITWTNRDSLDVAAEGALEAALRGHRQVVHLASPVRREGHGREAFARHLTGVGNVLRAARAAGCARVLVMSSVNASEWRAWRTPPLLEVASGPPPGSDWGRVNLEAEALCRQAAAGSELDVVVVRLGGVWWPDYPLHGPEHRRVWLSHEDLGALFRACLTSPVVPRRVTICNAVSDVAGRVHDLANSFGWAPVSRGVGAQRWLRHQVIRAKSAIATATGLVPRRIGRA